MNRVVTDVFEFVERILTMFMKEMRTPTERRKALQFLLRAWLAAKKNRT